MFFVYRWQVFLGTCLFLLLFVNSSTLVQELTFPSDPNIELEVISTLNEYRIRDGRYPLARNANLDYLAQIQAEYMTQWLPLTEDDLDYHADSFGDGVNRRAELIGWQGYGFPSEVYITEIAAYFPSVQGMMDFWNNSDIHRRAVYEYGYREVGVAVIRNKSWYLTYVVFGGRPNVLPVLYHSERNMLFLTLDQSPFGDHFVPARVQILDENDERLHSDEWLLWQSQIPLPSEAEDEVTIVYSDGEHEIRTHVVLEESRVYPSLPMTDRSVAVGSTNAIEIVEPTEMPPVEAVDASGEYQVEVVYDGLSLTIINQSGRPLNFDPFSIYVNTLDASIYSDWLGAYSEIPLSRLPDGFCLQIWSSEQQVSPPPLPEDCVLLASGRSAIGLGDRFWLTGFFEVRYNERIITNCFADNERCVFDLPER